MKRDDDLAVVKQVCERLRNERENQQISQQKLSELAGMSRTGLRHVESQQTSPTLYSLLKIANALQVELTEIIGESLQKK